MAPLEVASVVIAKTAHVDSKADFLLLHFISISCVLSVSLLRVRRGNRARRNKVCVCVCGERERERERAVMVPYFVVVSV